MIPYFLFKRTKVNRLHAMILKIRFKFKLVLQTK